MPATLIFNERKGCKVTYTEGNCQVVPGTNELILTNVIKERTPGGTTMKFVISSANNPIGARYAGDWAARTEGVFSGQYYTVDGEKGGFSFKAKAGYIKSTLDYEGETTFSEQSKMRFNFETEHSVPKNGYIKVVLPIEMTFPSAVVDAQKPVFTISQKVINKVSTDVAKFVNVTAEYIMFVFENGHEYLTDNPIKLTLEKIRTPRSFRPSSEFVIETMS